MQFILRFSAWHSCQWFMHIWKIYCRKSRSSDNIATVWESVSAGYNPWRKLENIMTSAGTFLHLSEAMTQLCENLSASWLVPNDLGSGQLIQCKCALSALPSPLQKLFTHYGSLYFLKHQIILPPISLELAGNIFSIKWLISRGCKSLHFLQPDLIMTVDTKPIYLYIKS